MNLINLTKYPLLLYDTEGALVEIPPDARHIGVAALSEHRTIENGSGHFFSLTVRRVREVKGMPEPEAGTLYIVPVEVAMALQENREDVAFPAEEAQVRDAEGRLRRVTHLRRVLRARANGER